MTLDQKKFTETDMKGRPLRARRPFFYVQPARSRPLLRERHVIDA